MPGACAPVKFADFECSPEIGAKLWYKHHVDVSEVQEVLEGDLLVRRGRYGRYHLYGRTLAGRDLGGDLCEVRSARDMTGAERRAFWRR